jgi:single-stranded DNA-binding protein
VHCNVVTLVGRVSQAGPELSYASSGTPVYSLVVEVDEFGPGDKIFTSWLPVRTTGKHAEQTSVDLEPGDIVMVSGKLKYESSVDKQTQQKTSKLIISSWGIQQRQPAQDDSASGGSVSPPEGATEIVQPEPTGAAPAPKARRPRVPKIAQRPWVPQGLVSEN